MEFVLSFVGAMLVSMALLPGLIAFGRRYSFVDEPAPRKVHVVPVPRIGGPAIAAGVLAAVALSGPAAFSAQAIAILVAGMIVLGVGLVDDRHELGYRIKFAAQIAAALVVVYAGDIRLKELTLPSTIVIPDWASMPVSVFVIVAITNAVALSDGLDGLAGGIVFLCAAALAVLAYSTGNTSSALLAVGLAGAIFGFLRFNTHPAVVFMGDSGSQFLGLISGVLAIEVTQAEAGRISAALPLFLLAVPIIDTTQVMISRILGGKSPFVADRGHLHHRLLALGLAHRQVVLAIYVLQCLFFLLAYFLRYESDSLIVAAFLVVTLSALGALILAERHQWGDRRDSAGPRWFTSIERGERRRAAGFFSRVIVAFVMAYGLLLTVAISASSETATANQLASLRQVQILSIGLILVVGSCVILRRGTGVSLLFQGAGYILAAMLAFMASAIQWPSPWMGSLESVLLVSLVVADVLWLALYNRHGSQLTTLDILILFGVLVIPNLALFGPESQAFALLALRMAAFFYAAEVIAVGLRPGILSRLPLLLTLSLLAVHPYFTAVSRWLARL